MQFSRSKPLKLFLLGILLLQGSMLQAQSTQRIYRNELKRLVAPKPLLSDYPEFVQPIREETRFEAPRLVDDPNSTLSVRAWRFSYNARGIIEMPNRLSGKETAIIMVHPWGIDDGQGWQTPEPAGVCDFCTPTKNHLAARHTREVIDPFLKSMRPHVAYVMFSLPGTKDAIRGKAYRSFNENPPEEIRVIARQELHRKLTEFDYRGSPLPESLTLSSSTPVIDYFKQFAGLDASDRYNGPGFWNQPIPVCKDIRLAHDDVIIYDAEGYEPLRSFLKSNGVRHILLTGYATDMCFCKTTAGYENLSKDFNVFLVGDATLATFPANDSPRFATNAHISFASLNQLVTQISWVELLETPTPQPTDPPK